MLRLINFGKTLLYFCVLKLKIVFFVLGFRVHACDFWMIVREELSVGDQPLSILEANKKCHWDPRSHIYEIFVLKK